MSTVELIPPPRMQMSGNNPAALMQAFAAMQDWLWQNHELMRVALDQDRASLAAMQARIDAVGALGPLSQTISATPTQAEVQAVQDRLNAVIQAAKAV